LAGSIQASPQNQVFPPIGESGSIDMNAVNLALPGIRQLMDQYAWKDIYNMDETGFFFRM
jgi:hypothetical protein